MVLRPGEVEERLFGKAPRLRGDRQFESGLLQQGVRCEPVRADRGARRSPGFARLPWLVFWNRNGLSVLARWRPAFSDHWSGSDFWNHEPNRDRRPSWLNPVYTEKHHCLTIS